MPLSDQVLELVFSFLLEGKGRTERDLQLAAMPACRLLQTRRMRGFDHVTLEVCRMGLGWAMRGRTFFLRATKHYTAELDRLERRLQRMDPARYETGRDQIAMLEDEYTWYV